MLSPASNSPETSSAGDNNGFEVSPADAYGNDGLFAVDNNSGTGTKISCTDNGKDKHRFWTFGINLPSGTQVHGIQVRLDARADSTSGAPMMCVQLSWNGGLDWTSTKSTAGLTTSEAIYILGGSSDTWGRAWTVTDLSNTNFRVRVIDVASSTERDFSLDWVAVKVSFQP